MIMIVRTDFKWNMIYLAIQLAVYHLLFSRFKSMQARRQTRNYPAITFRYDILSFLLLVLLSEIYGI